MIDAAACIQDTWFRAGFQSAADMAVAGAWISNAELYQWADDAAKYLARTSSLFLVYDTSINVVAGTPQYALPDAHVFTITAWLSSFAGAVVKQLRITTVGQLFALDANWAATVGAPTRISFDAAGVDYCVLYPSPIAQATLAQIAQEVPATLTAGASTLMSVSAVLQDYFTDWIIAGALSKESDFAKPEVAAHLKERLTMMDAVIQHLFGGGV